MACFAALVWIASSSPAQTQPVSAPALRDGSHDMDFSFGTWRTDITIFKDPFDPSAGTSQMTGTKRATPVWNGKAALEEIEADGPGGHWEAANLMLYDPAAHQWSQNYVDSETGRLDPPSIGEYRNGQLEFTWQERIDGRSLLERGLWTLIDANSHTYEVARSADGGRTWHTAFIAKLTRIK